MRRIGDICGPPIACRVGFGSAHSQLQHVVPQVVALPYHLHFFSRDRSTFVLTLLLLLPACLQLLLFISATPTTKSGELTWKRVDTYTVNFELRTAWERTGYPTTLTRMTVSLRHARSPPAR